MDEQKDLFIYGTGLTAKHVYELVKEDYKKIIFLNRNLEQYNCVSEYAECWTYTDKRITDELKRNSKVIVAIMNTLGDIRGVMNNLKEEGFCYIIPYAKLADIYPDKFEFLYLESVDKFKVRYEKIEEARKILEFTDADARSKEVFEAMIRFRETKDYNDLPQIDRKRDQYFPREISGYRTNNICYIDCGAYIGDTFSALIDYSKDVKSKISYYVGIEPDIENYKKLEMLIKNTKEFPFDLYQCAVCETKKNLYFDMQGTTASKVDREVKIVNQMMVKGISIDELNFQIIPTHIKMDIEGEEKNALLGAEKLIKTYKPKLAICIYHKPEDIYEIMELINSWELGYRFEMRVYEDVGVDLVLYAI